MGRSFYYTQSYSQLRTKSQTFSDLINDSPTSFGITALQAAAFEALNDDYAVKFALADANATRTPVAIINRNESADALRLKAAEIGKIIEATPTVTNGQRESLGLSVRKQREPMGMPGTCTNFKAELMIDGSMKGSFKANNPKGMSGVTYQVWRRFGSEGEFSYLLATGEKKFIDATIHVGVQQVQYQIRGIRPLAAGEWAKFVVNFGQASSGNAMMASVVQTPVSPKLAA